MASWTTPKTNWALSDYLNFEDLNRVEENTHFVYDRLIQDGYFVNPQTYKTNWAVTDIVFKDDLNRIEQNIKDLAQAYYTTSEFEELKTNWQTLEPVDFNFPNRIEKDLNIINRLISSMEQYFVYCGVASCGQSRLWQVRFRNKRNWNGVPFENFNSVPSSAKIKNISISSDAIEENISINSSVYGTILLLNSKNEEIDGLVGNIENF